MEFTLVWFLLIAVLWTGYFVLEGFDFGVGILLPFLARNEADRRILVRSIGPVWDGDHVWLLVAGGAAFAAFPESYATLVDGFSLPLFLILLSMIVRRVALECRDKASAGRWDRVLFWGSLGPAFLWGMAFAEIVRDVPLDGRHEYTGTLLTLLDPYPLLGGLATLGLFTLHGSVFLALRTSGVLRDRAVRSVRTVGPVTMLIGGTFLVVTQVMTGDAATWGTAAAAAGIGCVLLARWGRGDGRPFAANAVVASAVAATLFAGLSPDVMAVLNVASVPYTLTVMTWVAAVFIPLVLVYQGWTYVIFSRGSAGQTPVRQADQGAS